MDGGHRRSSIAPWTSATPRTRPRSATRSATGSRPTCRRSCGVTEAARRASTHRRSAHGAGDCTRRLRGSDLAGRVRRRRQVVHAQAILLEEMARAEAPPHVGVIGLGMAGPTIIAHGSRRRRRATWSRSSRRRTSGARDSRSPGRAPTWRASGRAPGSTTAASSSTGRRSGPRAHRRLVPPARAQRPGLAASRRPDVPDRGHARAGGRRCGRCGRSGESEFNEIFFTGVEVPAENTPRRRRPGVAGGDDHAAPRARHADSRSRPRSRWAIRKLIDLARDCGATRSSATSRASGSSRRRSA